MVVVDSSALIPLARIGELRLLDAFAVRLVTTQTVRRETLEASHTSTAALARHFEGMEVLPAPSGADDIAERTGVTPGDAAILQLASEHEQALLAQDRALLTVARTMQIRRLWLYSLLLDAVAREEISADRAERLLLDVVEAGANVHPRIYARLHRQLGVETRENR